MTNYTSGYTGSLRLPLAGVNRIALENSVILEQNTVSYICIGVVLKYRIRRIVFWDYSVYNQIGYVYLHKIYVRNKEYLWGLQRDKSFTELFIELAKDFLEFDCFCVFGGASRECCGYLFIVHPDETIHVYSPHVHVKKDGVSTRYDLETFKRYPEDKVTRAHIRDEKKVIVPFLKANKEWLQEKWNLAMLGYIPPIEDEQGKQFCNES